MKLTLGTECARAGTVSQKSTFSTDGLSTVVGRGPSATSLNLYMAY